jgi:HEAT repeat protein
VSVIWALGILLVGGRTLAGRLMLGRLFAQADELEAPRRRRFEQVARRLRISTAIRVRISAAISVPLVFGWRRPRLLLPATSGDWSERTEQTVFLHELAHVHRGDLGRLLLARIATALYWPHPLAWLGLRRLEAEAENACDDVVLQEAPSAKAYAGVLLEIARQRCPPAYSAAVATIASRGPLERRIRAIIDPSRRRGRLRRSVAFASGAVAVVMLVPIASVPAAPMAAVDAPRTLTRIAAASAGEPIAGREPSGRLHTEPLPPVASEAAADCDCSDDLPWWLAERPEPDRADDLEGLLSQLTVGEPEARAGVARALGDWPVARARRALHRAAVEDTDPRVRAEAITSLARSPARQDLAVFLAGLDDPSCRVSERAAEALAELGVASAATSLIERLDRACRVRVAAARALASFHSASSAAALRGAVHDADSRVRAAAAASLGVVGDGDAVETLLDAMADDDGQVREAAVRALAERRLGVATQPRVVAELVGALEDESPYVRQAAADALAVLGDQTAVDALVAHLAEENKHVRQAAAHALGRIGGRRALPSLERLASLDSSPHVRQAAAEAVERLERHH